MKSLVRGAVSVALISLLAACGGSGATPAGNGNGNGNGNGGDAAPSAATAQSAFNDAVTAALQPGSGVTVVETATQATLTGSITADDVSVQFSNTVLAKKPFAVTGSVTLGAGSHAASISFADSSQGSYVVDGTAIADVHASIPMVSSFVQATASWALHAAWGFSPAFSGSNGGMGQGGNPCNVTVSDDGNGGVVLDGSCSLCGATITFTMLDVNPMAGSITGTITIDDGNGNTAVLTFNGTSVDVMVDGQDLGTFDLSQIFGGGAGNGGNGP